MIFFFFLTEKLLLQGTCYMVSIAAVNEAGEGEIEKVYVYTLETGEKYISEILGYVEKIFYNIFRF